MRREHDSRMTLARSRVEDAARLGRDIPRWDLSAAISTRQPCLASRRASSPLPHFPCRRSSATRKFRRRNERATGRRPPDSARARDRRGARQRPTRTRDRRRSEGESVAPGDPLARRSARSQRRRTPLGFRSREIAFASDARRCESARRPHPRWNADSRELLQRPGETLAWTPIPLRFGPWLDSCGIAAPTLAERLPAPVEPIRDALR